MFRFLFVGFSCILGFESYCFSLVSILRLFGSLEGSERFFCVCFVFLFVLGEVIFFLFVVKF